MHGFITLYTSYIYDILIVLDYPVLSKYAPWNKHIKQLLLTLDLSGAPQALFSIERKEKTGPI